MTHNELWLTYHQVSRCNKPVTAQLIELEFQNHRLLDLEDVLEHLFRQGFIEAKHRPVSFWENHEGHRVQGGHSVEELLKNGSGKCPQTALRLVIADSLPVVWFSYHYLHRASAPVVVQRVRLDAVETKFKLVAQLTNHIFHSGYLPAHLRTKVYWKGSCGRNVEEHERLQDLLEAGDGTCETSCLRLNIGRLIFGREGLFFTDEL
ncbi:hypothetical protein PAXRUDRAFT_147010 [Paxillus rubicundulus Ve08.2h10]|uniref:Uncharacterized protein n=1 Tax=Paxillus rubicundulus Ve08.2h10 TaxID=930991 RepID=A0A0D0DZJ7_9AGAM|nr:hypothetical protein PAXRUDRAFT_147010 [Paxillus rubicundulus Ve08.2h10]